MKIPRDDPETVPDPQVVCFLQWLHSTVLGSGVQLAIEPPVSDEDDESEESEQYRPGLDGDLHVGVGSVDVDDPAIHGRDVVAHRASLERAKS